MRIVTVSAFLVVVCSAALLAQSPLAQSPKVMMPEDLFRRNIGTREQMNKQFPPHKIVGNLYYVGSESLAIVSDRNAGRQHSDQQRL